MNKEEVHTVFDYWDGPTEGVADYGGKPYHYKRVFDDKKGVFFDDMFYLTPISKEVYDLFMQEWEIWKRWEKAYKDKKVNSASHPALPEYSGKYIEVKKALDVTFTFNEKEAFIAKGIFDPVPNKYWGYEVSWTVINGT